MRKAPGVVVCDAPGCALPSMTTDMIKKMRTSTGNAYRSNAWIRLCPRNATMSWMTTTISRQSTWGRGVSAAGAGRAHPVLPRDPADPAGERVNACREDVSPVAEAAAAEHHLRNAVT